ncbi:MAG: nucleotidyltransferase domain-containing protein [Gemmatales bacterium]
MSALEELQKKCQSSWEHLHAAQREAHSHLQALSELVLAEKTESQHVSVVIFGSLARREWTQSSDLDWTLLIDGPVDSRHATEANRLAHQVKEAGFKQPGPSALFGKLAISHNLVHEIGGQEDSNRNLTQRLLLLLESRAVEREEAHRRVLDGVLSRYLTNDPRTTAARHIPLRVPRFLCNDVVRYWRTMCVDYANKYRDRNGEGWAIRHLKLRLSRKLIFTAGLLLCFSCDVQLFPDLKTKFRDLFSTGEVEQAPVKEMVDYLRSRCNKGPLESLAEMCLHFGKLNTAKQIFDAYDAFLEILRDQDKRSQLSQLDPEKAETDVLFQQARDIGKQFHEGLVHLFFDDHARLAQLTKHYGVF